MRVLWFSINSACYSSKLTASYNGGGWISSLEKIVKKHSDIQLGIAFEYNSSKFKDSIDGVDYYPINICCNRKEKYRKEFTIANEEKLIIPECLKIIDDFKPDIIQCFGSEWCFGLVANYTNIPVIIHMQGSMPSYYNVLYPPRYSKWSRMHYDFSHLDIKNIIRSLYGEKKSRQRKEREIRILNSNNYFFGRTDWDRAVVELFSQNSKYFVCNEALRDAFIYTTEYWRPQDRDEIIICTTGSGGLWKGLDVILKTANCLKQYTDLKFKWILIGGIQNRGYIEWMEKLLFADNCIEFAGILNDTQIKEKLLTSDMYVHPAYIDNSPNALCEAMFLGVPCIASYVGGIPSIIQNRESGLLVPVNEPYYLAEKIYRLSKDKMMQKKLSAGAMKIAKERHSPKNIEKELITAYRTVTGM